MCGASKAKVDIPFPANVVLESGALFYCKAIDAMQAHDAAPATRMHIPWNFPKRLRKQFFARRRYRLCRLGVVALNLGMCAPRGLCQEHKEAPHSLELSRAVRPWEALPITGTRASLLGNESGRMEAWGYPLKILRDFHLKFHTEGRVLPAEALGRTVTVRPESATIVYAGDTFTVRETFFVPVREQGAVILLDVQTEQPLEIEAVFHRDFQLEWPAALGATSLDWIGER